jgi:hypothetical protein
VEVQAAAGGVADRVVVAVALAVQGLHGDEAAGELAVDEACGPGPCPAVVVGEAVVRAVEAVAGVVEAGCQAAAEAVNDHVGHCPSNTPPAGSQGDREAPDDA